MSIAYRYECELKNKDTLIDVIYCSSVQMSIPINYFFTVLLKDGMEYDLTNKKLNRIFTNPIDINAFEEAKKNYLKLIN